MIGPMVLYVCERLIRFIRYMQTVRYRKVRLIRHRLLSFSAGSVPATLKSVLLCPPDRDAAVQGAGAAAGEERFQNGGGSVRLPQLPGHLPAGVAPVHHDLCPRGGLLQRPHPFGRGLDRQTHRHRTESTRGCTGTQVSISFKINLIFMLF